MPCHAMHPMQDYFWKVFHKYYNLICIFICTPICTKKFLFLQNVGVTGDRVKVSPLGLASAPISLERLRARAGGARGVSSEGGQGGWPEGIGPRC
jgi:hypothetical protein